MKEKQSSTPEVETAPEHRKIMAYMNSSEWEVRLSEARRKREKILEAKSVGKPARPKPWSTTEISSASRLSSVKAQDHSGEAVSTLVPSDGEQLAPAPTEAAGSRKWLPVAGLAFLGTIAASALGLVVSDAVGIGGPRVQNDIVAATDLPPARLSSGPRDDIAASSVVPLSSNGAAETAGTVPRDTTADLADALKVLSADQRITLVTTDDHTPDFARLTHSGGTPIKIRTTPYALTRSTVSYFHDDDAAAATLISDHIAADMLDLRGLMPSPPVGTLEVLLAGG